jgi:hypothetical protein
MHPGGMSFAIGCIREHRADVLDCQLGVVVYDILFRLAGSQPVKHILHRDTKATNARFATSLPGLKGDTALVSSHATVSYDVSCVILD